MALDANTLTPFVEPLRASRKWNTKPPRTVNDEIFFIRRATYYGASHPAWKQEAGQPKRRVENAVSRRRERVGAIVRRAAALHDQLSASNSLPMALAARERPRKPV
jgi:hypothetical protein